MPALSLDPEVLQGSKGVAVVYSIIALTFSSILSLCTFVPP